LSRPNTRPRRHAGTLPAPLGGSCSAGWTRPGPPWPCTPSPRPSAKTCRLPCARRRAPTAAEVRALGAEVADGADRHAAERAAWEKALGRERACLAAQLLPARRAAAARIGKLVEALSREIADARAAQTGLAELGVLAVDPGYAIGSLAEHDSALSRWNRCVLAEGLLR
jgi:hypothetical protein